MTPKNDSVRWSILAPVLVAIAIACLGSTAYLVDKSEDSIHGTIRMIQVDLREVRNDVKNLLKGM